MLTVFASNLEIAKLVDEAILPLQDAITLFTLFTYAFMDVQLDILERVQSKSEAN